MPVITSDTFGPINIQSGKVSKSPGNDKGETAHRAQWISAPPDRYFVEDTWKISMISSAGKNAYIRVTEVKRKPVSIVLPNGSVVTHEFVVQVHVVAHAETGSGYSADTKTAWAEGEFTAEMQEFS
jgi:hypothetical protein